MTACLTEGYPGETVCEELYGPTALEITSADSTAMTSFTVYLRFDFDQALVGTSVAAVTLEMTAGITAQAASDHSGSVWQSNPFTQASIGSDPPGKTAMPMLAADRGAVAPGAAVDWSLPHTLVTPASPLCVELESSSPNNVIYDRNAPPTVFVDVY